MTEEEFEYEFLQDNAYKQWLEEIEANNNNINVNSNTFGKQFTMDHALYDHIAELNESGVFIDFEISADAPSGRRYSDIVAGRAQDVSSSDLVPVDMSQFGAGETDGG